MPVVLKRNWIFQSRM